MILERSSPDFIKQGSLLVALSGGGMLLRTRACADGPTSKPRPRSGACAAWMRRNQDVQGYPVRREHRGKKPVHAAGEAGALDRRARRAAVRAERAAAQPGRAGNGRRLAPPPTGCPPKVKTAWSSTSGRRRSNDGRKRPVMFWCHGGGFATGSGSSPVTDGTNLARRGDVVVVSINHRLNVLGFTNLVEAFGGASSRSRAMSACSTSCRRSSGCGRTSTQVRRRSEHGHDLRPVGRRAEGQHAADDAVREGTVPSRDDRKRCDHQAGRARSGARAWPSGC